MTNPREALARALDDFKRYEFNQMGCRYAVRRDIPNAIEAMIEAKVAEALAKKEAVITGS